MVSPAPAKRRISGNFVDGLGVLFCVGEAGGALVYSSGTLKTRLCTGNSVVYRPRKTIFGNTMSADTFGSSQMFANHVTTDERDGKGHVH